MSGTTHANHALITGGARRMGAEMVRHLAAAGWRVLLHWHQSREEAESLLRELGGERLELAQADLSSTEGRRSLVEQAKRFLGERPLDLLVHNASIFPHQRLAELDDPSFDLLFALHVKAPVLISRDLEADLALGGGLIVTMLDAGAPLHWPGYLAYSLSKLTLREATIALARQLAPRVRVNGIAPGFILPPEDAPESYREAEALRLTRATGAPLEILKALDYLLQADFVTGEILTIDGGRRWIRPLAGAASPN